MKNVFLIIVLVNLFTMQSFARDKHVKPKVESRSKKTVKAPNGFSCSSNISSFTASVSGSNVTFTWSATPGYDHFTYGGYVNTPTTSYQIPSVATYSNSVTLSFPGATSMRLGVLPTCADGSPGGYNVPQNCFIDFASGTVTYY